MNDPGGDLESQDRLQGKLQTHVPLGLHRHALMNYQQARPFYDRQMGQQTRQAHLGTQSMRFPEVPDQGHMPLIDQEKLQETMYGTRIYPFHVRRPVMSLPDNYV